MGASRETLAFRPRLATHPLPAKGRGPVFDVDAAVARPQRNKVQDSLAANTLEEAVPISAAAGKAICYWN
jgi:hypothetical protein